MPGATLVLPILDQATFDAQHPNGGPMHFRNQYRDPAHTQLITYRDPIANQDTGKSAREVIQDQATAQGWPLIGIYISGWGRAPHCAIHRLDFPSQTGNPEARAEKLQNALDAALESLYKSTKYIDDPTDPDYGQNIDIRNFWVSTHVWVYRNNGLYDPSFPNPDYVFRVGDTQPRPGWWQQLA